MTTEELEPIVYQDPFKPFRVVLMDGEEIVVKRPRKSLLSGPDLALVGVGSRDPGPAQERFRLVCIDRIKSAESLSEHVS